MSLRATRAALEILGRGTTTRLNATRVVTEVLGHGATDRTQVTRVQGEVLGEYVLPTGVVTTFRAEVLGHGGNDRVQATQVQCEVLGEPTVSGLRVTLLASEVLASVQEPAIRVTQVRCEVLGEPTIAGLRVTAVASEVLGAAEVAAVQATRVDCEILGERFTFTLHVTALGSELLGRGDTDCIQNARVHCEVLGEFGSPELRVVTLLVELLADSPNYGSGMIYYGTLTEADSYFASRLHESAWSDADPADRPKALWAATQIIDTLNYKGYKHPVYLLLQEYGLQDIPSAIGSYGSPTAEKLMTAEASQELEFPRGSDTEVPLAIRRACFEIAHSLLDGKDPELELENLGIVSQGYSSVRTTFSRTHVPVEHVVNGVPSSLAWRLLLPFLRDDEAIRVSRVS
jgi:hypothetical protein